MVFLEHPGICRSEARHYKFLMQGICIFFKAGNCHGLRSLQYISKYLMEMIARGLNSWTAMVVSTGNLFILSYTHVWGLDFISLDNHYAVTKAETITLDSCFFLIFSWLQLLHGFDKTFNLHSLVNVS